MEELPLAESKKTNVAKSPTKSKAKKTRTAAKSSSTTKQSSTTSTQAGKTKTKKLSINKSAATTDQMVANAVNMEQRLDMIAKTAYFLAEKRGFSGGNPTEDWLQAEQEVDTMLDANPEQIRTA